MTEHYDKQKPFKIEEPIAWDGVEAYCYDEIYNRARQLDHGLALPVQFQSIADSTKFANRFYARKTANRMGLMARRRGKVVYVMKERREE